jgi:hypothetical protein
LVVVSTIHITQSWTTRVKGTAVSGDRSVWTPPANLRLTFFFTASYQVGRVARSHWSHLRERTGYASILSYSELKACIDISPHRSNIISTAARQTTNDLTCLLPFILPSPAYIMPVQELFPVSSYLRLSSLSMHRIRQINARPTTNHSQVQLRF